MITSDQIPPGWRPDMSIDEVVEGLVECARNDNHMSFATQCVAKIGAAIGSFLFIAILEKAKTELHRANLIKLLSASGATPKMMQIMALINHQDYQADAIKDEVVNWLAARGMEGQPMGLAEAERMVYGLNLDNAARLAADARKKESDDAPDDDTPEDETNPDIDQDSDSSGADS